jgi:hypothetical protein
MYFVHKLGFGSPQVVTSQSEPSTVRPQVVDSSLLITGSPEGMNACSTSPVDVPYRTLA